MSTVFLNEYEKWLSSPVLSDEERNELEAIRDNPKEIESRFFAPLSFGTAGLRGTMGTGLHCMNRHVVRQVTQGMAELIKAEKAEERGVAIAFDCRNNSNKFSKEASQVLAANGIKVFLFDAMRPTPELSFAIRELGCIAGINVTASHNPKEYNGFKAYWQDGAQLPPEHADTVEKMVSQIDIFTGVKLCNYDDAVANGYITILGKELDDKFLEVVMKQAIDREPVERVADTFKLVYTPFHGTGYKLVPEALKRLGIKNIHCVEEQMIPDGNFPTVKSPNPEERAGFELGIKLAEKVGADLIIGTDPDADRVGIVVRNSEGGYQVVSGNQTGVLLLDYIISARNRTGSMPENPYTIKTIVTTEMAREVSEKNGITMYDTFTGFKFIAEKINDLLEEGKSCIFSYEESFGYLIGEHCRDKDAVTASMLLAEMAAYYEDLGMTLFDALEALHDKYGHFSEETVSITMRGLDGLKKMKDLMEALRNGKIEFPAELDVDVKVDYLSGTATYTKTGITENIELEGSDVLSFIMVGGTKLMVRPSGTEPKIKFYLLSKGKSASDSLDGLNSMKKFVTKFQ